MAKLSDSIANRYAAALFSELSEADYDAADAALAQIAEGIDAHSELQNVLATPSIGINEKLSAVEDVAKLFTSNQQLINFVLLCCSNGRSRDLPALSEAFSAILREYKQARQVKVSSAFELPEAEKEEILKSLRAEFGQQVHVDYETDPELLGGLRIQCGDHVLDSSVRGRLDRVREQLVSDL